MFFSFMFKKMLSIYGIYCGIYIRKLFLGS